MTLQHAIRSHLHQYAQTAAAKLEELEALFDAIPDSPEKAKAKRALRRLHKFGASVYVETLGFSIAETAEQGDTGVIVFGPGAPGKDDDSDEA